MGSGILGIQFDASLMDGYQQGNISQIQFLKEQSSHGLVQLLYWLRFSRSPELQNICVYVYIHTYTYRCVYVYLEFIRVICRLYGPANTPMANYEQEIQECSNCSVHEVGCLR